MSWLKHAQRTVNCSVLFVSLQRKGSCTSAKLIWQETFMQVFMLWRPLRFMWGEVQNRCRALDHVCLCLSCLTQNSFVKKLDLASLGHKLLLFWSEVIWRPYCGILNTHRCAFFSFSQHLACSCIQIWTANSQRSEEEEGFGHVLLWVRESNSIMSGCPHMSLQLMGLCSQMSCLASASKEEVSFLNLCITSGDTCLQSLSLSLHSHLLHPCLGKSQRCLTVSQRKPFSMSVARKT